MTELTTPLLLGAGVAALVACLVTAALLPVTRYVAQAAGIIDRNGGRKQHAAPTPRLGGVAMAVGIVVAALAVPVLFGPLVDLPRTELLAIALGAALVFAVGLYDDVTGASPLMKFVFQLAAAALLVAAGIRFEVLGLPFVGEVQLGGLSVLASVLWIVGVTNAINLIDGLDGLAGGVAAIIAGSFAIYATVQGNPLSVILTAALVGACLAFLRENWHPARIFMGDSGSLTLGFLLAAVSVHSSLKAPAAVAIFVPVLALGVPVIDTLLVMARRYSHDSSIDPLRRLLRTVHADRAHIHHLLSVLGGTRNRVVFGIYGLVFVFCAFSLTVALTKSALMGILLVLVELVAVVVVRRWGIPTYRRQLRPSDRSNDSTRGAVKGSVAELLPRRVESGAHRAAAPKG